MKKKTKMDPVSIHRIKFWVILLNIIDYILKKYHAKINKIVAVKINDTEETARVI